MLKQKERLFVSYLLWKKAAIRSKNSVAWTLVALVIYRHRKKLMNCMTQIREFHHQMRVKTFHKDQVPAYIGEDNEFIHYGHRPVPSTSTECIRSVCEYHNETFNIWSHVVACAYYLYRFNVHIRLSSSKKYTLPVQLLCSAFCFGVSAVAHTFNHHSQDVSSFLFSIDRAGIALVSCAHSMSVGSIHFEDGKAKTLYILIALLAAARTTKRVISEADPAKVFPAFVLQVGISGIPIMREVLMANDSNMQQVRWLIRDTLKCYVYGLLGGVTFGYRIPERFLPGGFDFLGNGHQLMHVLGFISSAYGYLGTKRYHNWKVVN